MISIRWTGVVGTIIAITSCVANAQTPIPNPQATNSGQFGTSISASANTIIVGAPSNKVDGKVAGVAYVFNDATGGLLLTIPNPFPVEGNTFGSSVSALGGHVLIGDPAHQPPNNATGSAYLFDIASGSRLQTFLDPKPISGGNYFGRATALDGNSALVADGVGNVYQFDINSGNLLQTYTQPASYSDIEFGRAIAASNGRLVVGSRGGDAVAAVHLFDTNTGAFLRSITNPNPAASAWFGNALAITDRWLIVGSHGGGSVHLFDVNTGDLLQTLTNPNPQSSSAFGVSVFALGDYILVGAEGQDSYKGAAFLFNGTNGQFLKSYRNSDAEAGDQLGGAVTMSGGRAFAAARTAKTSVPSAGVVYSFPSVAPPGITGDYDNSGKVDAADYAVWRSNVGYVVTPCSGGDANCNGFGEWSDYQPWRDNFGRAVGSSTTLASPLPIPEPSNLCLALAGLMLSALRSRLPSDRMGDATPCPASYQT